MKLLAVKIYLQISFSERANCMSRSDYVAAVIDEASHLLIKHDADLVEISGDMFPADVKSFKKALNLLPDSQSIVVTYKNSTTIKLLKKMFDPNTIFEYES